MLRLRQNKRWGSISFHVVNEEEIHSNIMTALKKVSIDENEKAEDSLKEGQFMAIDVINTIIRTSYESGQTIHYITLMYAVIHPNEIDEIPIR